MKDFTIGSMYWSNPNYTLDDFREDMRRIKANKVSLLRIMIVWEYVELERDKFDFSLYDKVFQAAKEYGIRIMGSFLFYLPIFRMIEQAENGNSDFDKRYPCLDRPEIRAGLSAFIAETVRHYAQSPVLVMWNVWNEPTDTRCHCLHSLDKFAGWVKRKYPTFADLKKGWSGEYIVFPPLLPPSLEALTGTWLQKVLSYPLKGRDTSLQLDWSEFQTENAAEHLAFLIEVIHQNDPVHETHTNPNCTTCNPLLMGISPWKIAREQDSISGSVHPHDFFAPLEKDVDKYPLPMLSVIDVVRSWGAGRDAWIGEYQAGSTYTKPNAYTPSGKDIAATLYHSFARNLRGVVFWEWQSWRHGAFETAEFGLRNPSDGGPTERSMAAQHFGEFLEQYQAPLAKVQFSRPEVAIFHSMDQFALDFLMESVTPGKNVNQHYLAAFTCQQSLAKAGIVSDFVTEDQLKENVLAQYKVLLLPYVRTMSPETAAKIKEFIANGGAVWADGRCGFLDKHLYLRKCVPGHGMDEVFGCREIDEVAPRPADALLLNDGSSIAPWRELQRFEVKANAEVLARCNGCPAAVRNRYRKGIAELWGTHLSANRSSVLDWMLPEFALRNGVGAPVRIIEGKEVLVSPCCSGETMLVVFTSLAKETQQITASLPVTSGKLLTPKAAWNNGKLELNLAPCETVAVIIEKN